MEDNSLSFHQCHIQKLRIFINRAHILLHSIGIVFLLYYRASFFFQETTKTAALSLSWLIIFSAELLFSFLWLLEQAYRWRSVTRSAFPERLLAAIDDNKLPDIDVFICTVDPEKEPTIAVMNTVLSAMAMDYPAEKLHVYLSDDGGSSLTLNGLREAWEFAKWWIPFCKSYNVKNRCPESYFSAEEDYSDLGTSNFHYEFKAEKEKIKEKYEVFKDKVREYARVGESRSNCNPRDHNALIEVMQESKVSTDNAAVHVKIPILVYVSREKRPSRPHHFKGGALNVLLRVSGIMSNSRYILVLDCDMYCNDPSAARRAMCFHLDPKVSDSLAFVQFPQRFRNISKSDIYDSQLRSVFSVRCQGLDGLRGPMLGGTGFFIKRLSLCGNTSTIQVLDHIDPLKLRQTFGQSNEFVRSLLNTHYKPNVINGGETAIMPSLLEEMKQLAYCTYENGTKWGEEVGFAYGSVMEDFLTGFILHCKGWRSVYCDPLRPQFLGCGTTNLDDYLIQGLRWSSGLVEVGISKFCPIIYGSSRMSILQSMCYADLAFLPLNFLPLWSFATIPQLCLLNGVPLYPEVTSFFFTVFSFLFLSSLSKHLYEVLTTGGSFKTWIYEQRIWMMKGVTSHLFGSAHAIMKRIGIREASFWATNKVEDFERQNLYQNGVFDFQTTPIFLVPMVTLVILNLASFLGGVARVIFFVGDLEKMLVQIFISFYILVINYPIIEGITTRKDKGRISPSVTALSVMFSVAIMALTSIIFKY